MISASTAITGLHTIENFDYYFYFATLIFRDCFHRQHWYLIFLIVRGRVADMPPSLSPAYFFRHYLKLSVYLLYGLLYRLPPRYIFISRLLTVPCLPPPSPFVPVTPPLATQPMKRDDAHWLFYTWHTRSVALIDDIAFAAVDIVLSFQQSNAFRHTRFISLTYVFACR